jgi:hypothetical protein
MLRRLFATQRGSAVNAKCGEMMKVAGSGSTPKCHGSATLVSVNLDVLHLVPGTFFGALNGCLYNVT